MSGYKNYFPEYARCPLRLPVARVSTSQPLAACEYANKEARICMKRKEQMFRNYFHSLGFTAKNNDLVNKKYISGKETDPFLLVIRF